MKIELQPFIAPNFVVVKMPPGSRKDGFKTAHSFHIREVDAETLDNMCREFRAEVFRKAEKPDPALLDGCGTIHSD